MLNKLIENTFKNTRLKRVRVKSDPSIPPVFGYENVSCFEGYVLEECGEGMVNVYIINAPPAADPIQQVSVAQLEPVEVISATPQISDIKTTLLKALIRAGHGEETPVYNQIRNTSSIDFIKAFLAQANISLEDLMAINNESTSFDASSGREDVFGTKETKFNKVLAATGKGLSFLTKAVGTGADLLLSKDNIVARLNKFLKSFNVNDLIDVKKITDKIKTPDYDHLPRNNEIVLLSGLPKLSYKRFKERKFQLKGQIKTVRLTTNGLVYVVENIEPTTRGIRKILLDFAFLKNPTKKGKIIFEDENGSKYYNKGTIVLFNNIWLINLGELSIQDRSVENKSDTAYIAAAITLLKETLGDQFDEISRRPDYVVIITEVSLELRKYRPETMAQIEKFFKEYLPKQPEYLQLSAEEKLNSIREYLKKFKEETGAS